MKDHPKTSAQRMAEYYVRLKVRMLNDPYLRHKVRQRMREASTRYYQRVKENHIAISRSREVCFLKKA